MFNLNVKSGCYNGATWLDEFKCENLVTPSGMERCFAIHFVFFMYTDFNVFTDVVGYCFTLDFILLKDE